MLLLPLIRESHCQKNIQSMRSYWGGVDFFQAVREGGGVTDSFISVHSWSLYHFRSQFSADLLTASIVRQTAYTYFLLVIEKWVQMKYNFFE